MTGSRCDGHHEIVDFRLKKAAACACFTSPIDARCKKKAPGDVPGLGDDCLGGTLDAPILSQSVRSAIKTIEMLGYSPLTMGIMLRMRALRAGFITPCLPSPAKWPTSGPGRFHEIKLDGFR